MYIIYTVYIRLLFNLNYLKMLQENNLPSWPTLTLVDYPENLEFRIVDENDVLLKLGSVYYGMCPREYKEEIKDLGKLFIAAPKMLEAILRFQKEYVVRFPSPEERLNNYSIEKQFQEAIDII